MSGRDWESRPDQSAPADGRQQAGGEPQDAPRGGDDTTIVSSGSSASSSASRPDDDATIAGPDAASRPQGAAQAGSSGDGSSSPPGPGAYSPPGYGPAGGYPQYPGSQQQQPQGYPPPQQYPQQGYPPPQQYPQQGYPPPQYQQPQYQQAQYQQAQYQQAQYQQPYGANPFGPAQAPKPGVVPLRPLGVGEVLDGAVSYIRAHPKIVLGASAIVAVISQIVQVPVVYALTSNARGSLRPGSAPDLNQLTGLVAGASAGGAVAGLINLLATTVLTGLLMVVISRSVLGVAVEAGECWQAAKPRILGLIGLTVLITLILIAIMVVGVIPGALVLFASRGAGVAIIVIGVIAAIVVAIWIGVSLSLAAPAYVLEGGGVVDAMRRSIRLVKGRWWPVLGIQLLAGLIAFVISAIVSVPFSFAGQALNGGSPVPGITSLIVQAIGTIIVATLLAPFRAGVTGLLYVDQRMRREGFDIELQRAASGGGLQG